MCRYVRVVDADASPGRIYHRLTNGKGRRRRSAHDVSSTTLAHTSYMLVLEIQLFSHVNVVEASTPLILIPPYFIVSSGPFPSRTAAIIYAVAATSGFSSGTAAAAAVSACSK